MFETHDGRLHIIKLYWFSEALKSGHFPVRWTETANHQYGYPIFIFYYPLLYYAASIPMLAGISLVDSAKIVLVGSFLLSGVFFYLFLREWVGRIPALTGAVISVFAPYRFISLYVTGRWGESFSFAMVPLLLWSLSKLKNDEGHHGAGWTIFSALSFGALILSHNIQALLVTTFILVFLIALHYLKPILIPWKRVFLIIVGGLAVSAFFWVPALYELKWTFQGQSPVYDYKENFPTLASYLYHPWGYGFSLLGENAGVSPMIGIAQLGAFAFALVALATSKNSRRKILAILLLAAGAIFFLMNRVSIPIWKFLPLLPSIQFPTRLTSLLIFISSILVALGLDSFKRQTIRFTIAGGFIALALYGNRNFLRPGVPNRFSDQYIVGFYQLVYGTGETAQENRPLWTSRLPDPYEKKIVIGTPYSHEYCPNVIIANESIKPRQYSFKIGNNTDDSYDVVVNTIYYPGWTLLVDGKKQALDIPTDKEKNPNGLIRFPVLPGTHVIRMWFAETPLRLLADIVSAGSLIWLLTTLIPQKKAERREH